MMHRKFLSTILLIVAVGVVAFASGHPQEKGGIFVGDSKEKKAPPKKEQNVGIFVDVDKPPPPPPPSLARLAVAITPPVPNIDVIVNGKPYRSNEKGLLPAIDLRTESAKIAVRNPDFDEISETIPVKKGQVTIEQLKLISKFGTLVLGPVPENAQVFIDDAEQTKGERDADKQKVSIRRIPVGPHKLKVLHPDYQEWTGEVDLQPGETEANSVPTDLKPAVAQLIMLSLRGAKVFVNNESKGDVSPEGKLVSEIKWKRENPVYNIKVVLSGYQVWEKTMKLAVGANPPIEAKLVPKPNSAEFDEYFTSGLSKWIAPPDWKAENGWLMVSGAPKIGLPKDANYRDFDAEFLVQMVNGKGVAWAVRVQGEEGVQGKENKYEYYLFYLGGPQGKYPKQFRTYICRDGKFDPEKPDNTVPTSVLNLDPKYPYTIRIEARGNKISTSIKPEAGPDAKGRFIPIGFFTDENNLFTYGSVGFTTVDGEEVKIKFLAIKPVGGIEEQKSASLN